MLLALSYLKKFFAYIKTISTKLINKLSITIILYQR